MKGKFLRTNKNQNTVGKIERNYPTKIAAKLNKWETECISYPLQKK